MQLKRDFLLYSFLYSSHFTGNTVGGAGFGLSIDVARIIGDSTTWLIAQDTGPSSSTDGILSPGVVVAIDISVATTTSAKHSQIEE